MDQTLQALQALYSSPDPDTKKQADDWLTQFQQTPVAWQVSDQILSSAETPMQFRFFAAQTMRTKVQFDFSELPADSYGSLRDSLIAHIANFRAPECQPIHTMLAITIADLVIQMDSLWPNAVQSLFEVFAKNPDGYATLLEILRMLPEECSNYKLMTDTNKRAASRERLQQSSSQVCQFVTNLPCPSAQAKKKVLECLLSWIKFTNLPASDITMLPESMNYVVEGTELSETATDIIVEVLKMSSLDLTHFQPVIQVILPLLANLRAKFEKLVAGGAEAALEADFDGMLQICRIYTETGETLVPLIMEQSANPEVLGILQVILRCTDLPNQEISSIPFEFWQRLATEVCRHPETDAKFQGLYADLLTVVIRRLTVKPNEDPFAADDELVEHRSRLLNLASDCLEILTPNAALEHVLKSLQNGQSAGVIVQEAHFFCLTTVGARAEVRSDSVLWALIQSLPPLIQQTVQEDSHEAALLYFTKKTAIELLGSLSKWVRTRPEFLRSSLEMISTLLMQPALANSPAHILERTKQVQQSASIAFKEICYGGRQHLHELMPNLIHLYVSTMALPIRVHLFIVDGIGAVAAHLKQDDDFRSALEQLVMPLVNGLSSEREKPQVLSEILDRLTMIIRQINVQEGSAKAVSVGALIANQFWPLMQQTLSQHPGDAKVVEKCCRLLKHSMRCVPDLFKPLVPAVASTLVQAFQAHQHSSYLYSAEILANSFAADPEIVPVLTQLFHQLSGTALTVLIKGAEHLEEITELVEDFYGMFERYLRYAPMIVLEAPTLLPTLQLWHAAIFVQQKDAIEAIIAFIEAVMGHIADSAKPTCQQHRQQIGQLLRPQAVQVAPGLVEAIFKLIAGVPTKYVQETLPCVLESIRNAFLQEFPVWLEAALNQLPSSAASMAEKQKFGEQLVRGDDIHEPIQDMCYRCEQVALRNRGGQRSTTGTK